MNLFVTIFDIVWLIAVLVFLVLIWRDGANRRNTTDSTLIDVTSKSNQAAHEAAEAAHEAAEAAHEAAETTVRLASYLEKRFDKPLPQ